MNSALIIGFAALCSVSSLVMAFLVFIVVSGQTKTGSGGGGGGGDGGPKNVLPLDDILHNKKKPWNTQSVGNKERLSVSDGVLTLRYAKNAHAGSSGAKISAIPSNLPADSIEFGYSVFFPSHFEFKKGGKLPGFCLGSNSRGCATGGDWSKSNNEGSVRAMWRSDDNKTAFCIGYVYIPVGGNPTKAYELQGPKYKAATDPGNRTGHDVWKKDKEFPLIKEQWNTIRFKVVMNTPKKNDGILEMEVNGKTKRVDDVRWRDSSDVKINNINLVSFYGGSGNEWNSPGHATFTQYKNFFIR